MKYYAFLIIALLVMNGVAFLSMDWQGEITGAQTADVGNVSFTVLATPPNVTVVEGGRGSGGGRGGGGSGRGPICQLGQKTCADILTSAVCMQTSQGITWKQEFCGEGRHCDNGLCVTGPFCTENWICEPFDECKEDGTQKRKCADLHGCGETDFIPPLTRTCTVEEEALIPPIVEIPGIIQNVVQKIIETIKGKPEIIFVPSGLVLLLLLIIGLGWRNEVKGILFHMRVKRFKKEYKKDPLRSVHKYFHKIKPEYRNVKDHIFEKTRKLYKEVSDQIEK